MTNNNQSNNSKVRGRKPIFTDEEFISVFNASSNIDEVVAGLIALGSTFEDDERAIAFSEWLNGTDTKPEKTEKQLKLFVSIRSSNLRKEGKLEGKGFKKGRRAKEETSETLRTIEEKRQVDAEVVDTILDDIACQIPDAVEPDAAFLEE